MKIVLCTECASKRGAYESHACDYEQLSLGIWRGRCEDCGKRGSSPALACFRLPIDHFPTEVAE